MANLFLYIDARLKLNEKTHSAQRQAHSEKTWTLCAKLSELHDLLIATISGGVRKNLEILRRVYLELTERLRMTNRRFLRGVYTESVEGLRMTVSSFRIHSYY